MNLLDSLLDAIVRLDGDALVMHVGEKPYVVTTAEATNQFRGPIAWGQVELSTRVLTVDAVGGMLGQILPLDQRSALDEFGATEYEVSAVSHPDERFTIVAARGGDDIWLEIRRQPRLSAAAAAAIAELQDEPLPLHAETQILPWPTTTPYVTVPVDAVSETPQVHLQESEDMAPEEDATPRLDVRTEEDEPVSVDLDPDRDLEEELLAIDGDFESGALADSQDWGDVMTEGELEELLRATAAAVIAGEIDPAAGAPPPAAATPLDTTGGPAGAEPKVSASTPQDLAVVEPAASAPIAVPVQPQAAMAPEPPPARAPQPTFEHHVSRATEELPALVEYQIERDRTAAQAPAPIAPDTGALLETRVESAAEPAEPLPIGEPVFVDVPPPTSVEAASGFAAEPPAAAHGDSDYEEAVAAMTEGTEETEDLEDATPSRPAAVVLPLTRQPRGESGADARASVATTLQRLLRLAAARGAATVYVVGHSAPLIRVDGEFSTLEGEPALSGAFVERLLAEVAPGGSGASSSAEWLIDVPEIGRVRCVTFRDHRGPGVIFRMVPARAIAADQLGLPAEVQALCSEADGLVLVTGARGSGKSTLLTSFVDLINTTRSDHIISIESQIDFVHEPKRSFISQREVRGEDAMVSAVRSASREEPDVLVVEDLRTQELATLALDAAESGRLVFASVPGLSTTSALERLIEAFPVERREKVQATLAGTLRGVVSQVLLRKLRGGRVAAREVLLNIPPVATLIMHGETFQLPAALENNRAAGMVSFAESLATLVREGIVHPAHAYRKAPNRDQFLAALRRNGIDTTIAERLG